jgi:hypothetical protein
VTPAEQIAFIAKEFPHLEQKTRTTQTSFGIKEMGARGRAIRIKHSNGELKLAATALRFPDRQYLFPKFKGPPDVLRKHVEGELEVLHNDAPGSGHIAPPVRNWQIALRALASLGGKATRKAILDEILIGHPAFDPENLRKDLTMLSVNDDARFSYRAIETKQTGVRADRDLVFRSAGHGDETVYEQYDPEAHGIWVPYLDESTTTPSGKGKMRLRRQDASIADLVPGVASTQPPFDPASATEGKLYVARTIAARQGQGKFRKDLMAAYGGRCCLSGCSITEIVDAAHIFPYAGASTNSLTNGLPLRTDLHALFDLGLIRIDVAALTWEVHPSLKADPEYAKFNGKVLKPVSISPSVKSIEAHRKEHSHKW